MPVFQNILQANPLVKDAAVFGLMDRDQGPEVHAVLLLDDASKAKTLIQQNCLAGDRQSSCTSGSGSVRR